jgi:hypothetical protein
MIMRELSWKEVWRIECISHVVVVDLERDVMNKFSNHAMLITNKTHNQSINHTT